MKEESTDMREAGQRGGDSRWQGMTLKDRKAAARRTSRHMKAYWDGLSHAKRARHGRAISQGLTGKRHLSAKDVREIRRLGAKGIYQSDIARHFGITIQQVSNILARRSWAKVK